MVKAQTRPPEPPRRGRTSDQQIEVPAQVGANFRARPSFHAGARLLSSHRGFAAVTGDLSRSLASGTAPTPLSPLPPLGLTTFHKLSGQHPTLPGPRTNPSPSHSLLLAVSSRKSSARPGPGGDSAGLGARTGTTQVPEAAALSTPTRVLRGSPAAPRGQEARFPTT